MYELKEAEEPTQIVNSGHNSEQIGVTYFRLALKNSRWCPVVVLSMKCESQESKCSSLKYISNTIRLSGSQTYSGEIEYIDNKTFRLERLRMSERENQALKQSKQA